MPSYPHRSTCSALLALVLASGVACGGAKTTPDTSHADAAVDTAPVDVQAEAASPVDLVEDDTTLPADTAAESSAPEVTTDTAPEAITLPTTVAFEHVETFTLFELVTGHLAFPDVARLPSGELLAVYRMGSGHVEPAGKLMKQLGSADGRIWQNPEVLYDVPGMDDRDPSVMVTEDGRVVVSYFQYETTAQAGGTLALHQTFVGISTDGGTTFGPFVQASVGPMEVSSATIGPLGTWVDGDGEEIIVSACSSAAIELGGALAVPVYGGNALDLSDMAGSPRSRLGLIVSHDGGATWTETLVAPELAPDVWLMEPSVLLLDDGTVVMHVRTADDASPSSPGHLLQTTSPDGGVTWTDYVDLGFVGHAPELYQLDNGVVVSGFRWLDEAYTQEKVAMVASVDRGATWGELIDIEACGQSECGYPGIIELPDDELLVIYYSAGGASIKGSIYHVTAE